MTPYESALAACRAGISVLPPKQDGSKAPDSPSWKRHQRDRATEEQIASWYANGRTGVGWVTGAVSGGLEVIDFDDRSTLAEYERLAKEAGLDALLELVKEGYFERTPNGAHLVYRCREIAGNTKLAKGKSNKSLIETRGEGGFIIVAPSHGSVNTSGAYEIESGGVDQITEIEPEDRKALHDLARMLDESIAPVDQRSLSLGGDRPGDDYNEQVSWADILTPHGWTRVSSRLGVTSWRRPGKDFGISATTNHADSGLLYVFSTSTCFDSERGYNKFSAYTVLNHNGDFKAASKALALLGYGQKIEKPDLDSDAVDLSLIMARWEKQASDRQTMEDLLRVPGLVGELADWINTSSVKPQPILALGASIAAVSTILGRKVQTQTGLRTNIYVLGVGHTGCGKERARQAVKAVYSAVDADSWVGEAFASDSAVETAVIEHPACLYLIDELGHFLGTVSNEQTPVYVRAILPILLRMYSASEGSYRRKTYADSKKNDKETVEQPCLSIYGTTVPQNLYGSISKAHASDGFLSRLLVFNSQDPDPHIRLTTKEDRRVPQSLIDGFTHWRNAACNTSEDGNLAEMHPDPLEVRATKGAWAVFDELEARMREQRRRIRTNGGDQGPYTRIWATAQKLALIRACGVRFESPEITEIDAKWGCDLAWLLTEEFLERVGECVAENKIEADAQRLLAIIKAHEHGISKSDLTRKSQWLTRSNRQDVIATLLEAGLVQEAGTKPTVYRGIFTTQGS